MTIIMINCQFEDGNKASLRHVTISAVIINNDQPGKVLLAKRAAFLKNPGKWCLLGGYLDRDETTSEGVCREVFEETGYKVKIVSLLRLIDQPTRPKEDRQNVEFAYVVEVVGHPGQIDKETTELKWFDLNEVPEEKDWAYDHGETLGWYKKWLKEKFRLPVVNNLSSAK